MKNVLLFALASFVSYLSSAQDSTVTRFKPSAKNLTVEVNFNPFSSSPVSINYLRLRTFVTDRQAFRMGFSIGVRNQKAIENVTQSTFEINLRPGYEWHFAGTERLSPYVGLDGDFAIKSPSFSDERDAQTRGPIKSISGAWDPNGTERGYTRFGANLLVGADYYIIKRLYLGLEFGYGFQVINSSDISVTQFNGAPVLPAKGGSTFQLGPNFNSSLRLGFAF